MRHLLLITTLDVEGRRNNREHHVLRQMQPRFDKVTVVYRKRGTQGGGLRALATSAVHRHTLDGICYVAVDPVLNPPEGQARSVGAAQRGVVRQLVRAGLDLAGIGRDWLTIRALARAARREAMRLGPPDHIACEAFGPWAARAAETLRAQGLLKKYAYVDRDYEPGFMTHAPRRRWAERMERRAAAQADLTLSIGRRLAARFDGIAGANVVLSPTGVDLDVFEPKVRAAPGPSLVFVGRIAPWSGIAEVLEAMVIARTRPACRLVVMGPSEPAVKDALLGQVGKLGLADRVIWHDDSPRDVVARALADASVGLAAFQPHPLRVHAAPLKLLEYMASGLPVIASSGSETGDLVTQSGAGVVCTTQAAPLAQAIDTILQDPDQYTQMSRAGIAAVQGLDWSDVMGREYAQLVTLYAGSPAEEKVA